jgi:peptidylprolyl isomerase
MKPSFLRRHRVWVFAVLLVPALTFNPLNPLFHASAQTNAPAPSGLASGAAVEKDAETGKPIVTTPSGLKYVDLAPGSGPTIKTGDGVTVNYVGKFMDGTVFDASSKHGGTFDYIQGVTGLISGWTEGTSTMKVGGKRKLIIPPNLGYGADGNEVIPPNSTLIFEIEVVAIKPGAPQ